MNDALDKKYNTLARAGYHMLNDFMFSDPYTLRTWFYKGDETICEVKQEHDGSYADAQRVAYITQEQAIEIAWEHYLKEKGNA